MEVTVCIGGSCHEKGSHKVSEKLSFLIKENHLEGQVTLSKVFCLGKCEGGVSVKVLDTCYTVTLENVEEFFEKNIAPNV